MSKAVCSNCQYIYDSRLGIEDLIPPGTPFGEADDSVFECPQCQCTKDSFLEVDEVVVEVTDPRDLSDMEAEHTATFLFKDDILVVTLGSFGIDHPTDPEHCIEWIEVRDEDGEPIDRQYVHNETQFYFSIDPEDPFEVVTCCNIHGLWRGISYESTNL